MLRFLAQWPASAPFGGAASWASLSFSGTCPTTTRSTLRLAARPCAVALLSTGRYSEIACG